MSLLASLTPAFIKWAFDLGVFLLEPVELFEKRLLGATGIFIVDAALIMPLTGRREIFAPALLKDRLEVLVLNTVPDVEGAAWQLRAGLRLSGRLCLFLWRFVRGRLLLTLRFHLSLKRLLTGLLPSAVGIGILPVLLDLLLASLLGFSDSIAHDSDYLSVLSIPESALLRLNFRETH